MAAPDRVFKQAYAWYSASIDRIVGASPLSPPQKDAVKNILWEALGVLNAAAPPANPDLTDFKDSGAVAESLAFACQGISETLVALGYIKDAVDALSAGGSTAAALGVVKPVMDQIERLTGPGAVGRYPSAFSIGKMLLLLSGDAQANPPASHEADKLGALVGAGDVANAQAGLGLIALVIGSLIDRSFTAPSSNTATAFKQQAIPDFAGKPSLPLAIPGAVNGTLAFDPGPPSAIRAVMALTLNQSHAIDGVGTEMILGARGDVNVLVPVAPPSGIGVSDSSYAVTLGLRRKDNAMSVGSDKFGATFSIGELGVALQLANGAPSLRFFAHDIKAVIKPADAFLRLILGDGIAIGLDIAAQADAAGKLRLTNGTGLHASLPLPTLPTGPFQLQLINLGIDPDNGSFSKLSAEISASFGVALGPFAASVDRLGVLLKLDLGGGTPIAFEFKPPNGIGLALDAGIVKGGGYLGVDANGYSGVLELKMLVVDVKAIALLNTKSDAGFSLLLLIFGQFPAIQLSFGFTLTGVGGLIGVQHTASPPALSQALSAGNLNAVLFPDNPVQNAPQIINTLRAMFPVKAGGFIIGPMLELGWGTPNLVTVRLGLLVEASQFTLLGQAIVSLPPLVSADIALLYLQLDFVGSVVFDPLRIAFDAKLIHSRVGFTSIFGQFAFRASFGDQPTFIISAGGFHPHFKDIPSDVPAPFDRVGMSYDIGVIGISFKGYFAITSATVQAGAELRAWGDIDVASIEGGFGFDAIVYLKPKFFFEVDVFAYLAVHVFDQDFASIHLDGTLSGPGRWHIAGNATVHTPWPLPDFSLHIDEHFGNDLATPPATVDLAALLHDEIVKIANWSAQLPVGGDALLTLATIDGGADLLAHPLGALNFQQKLCPFELRLDQASGSNIKDVNEFVEGALVFAPGVDPPPVSSAAVQTTSDFFAAGQFIQMSDADKLSKPSFERYTAGYKFESEEFDMGEIVPELMGYEEADLGAPRVNKAARRKAGDLFSETAHLPVLAFGAAGRSPLRDRALAQPEQPAALEVNPALVTVAGKSTLAVQGAGQSYTSVWRAAQARDAVTSVAVATVQVVELCELVA